MSEPIPDAAAGGIPDLAAAAALVDLITLLHTDPLARPLVNSGRDVSWYSVSHARLSIRLDDRTVGNEQLAAARALFGGDIEDETSYRTDSVGKILCTTWHGFLLKVHVQVPREDEVADLQKQLADLRATIGAGTAVAE